MTEIFAWEDYIKYTQAFCRLEEIRCQRSKLLSMKKLDEMRSAICVKS
jgi:hypothetical protein